MSAIRKWLLAAGTAALVSSQAAYAAPATSAPAIDPLLAVSALSSPSSCGAATACAKAIATPAALPAAAASAAAAQGAPYETRSMDWAGLAVLFAFPVVLILSMILEDGNEPISPG